MADGEMTRRERERQQHISHILGVAEGMFAEKGFFRTTMRQIARKAEFALGTIYAYFRSKRRLYEKVIEAKTVGLVDFVIQEMASRSSPRDQIEKFIESKMAFLHRNRSFLRMYVAELDAPRLDSGQVVPKAARESYDSLLHHLTKAIRLGIKEGSLKSMNPEVLARAIDGLTTAVAVSWLRLETWPPVEAETRVATELFLRGAAVRQQEQDVT